MDFQNISKKYKEIKSPVIDFAIHGQSGNSLESFTELLKKEDTNSEKILKRFYIIYLVVLFIYLLVFVVNPDSELNLKTRISGGCYVLAFLIFLRMLQKMRKRIKSINYFEAPKAFLNHAKERFSLWTKQQLPLIPFLVLINTGASLSLSNYFESFGIMNGLLLFQLIFLVLIIFGFLMGRREWAIKKKPILLKINEMLLAFEE